MCMNLNLIMLSGAVLLSPDKVKPTMRVRPEDGMSIHRFYLKIGKDTPPIICKSYGKLAKRAEALCTSVNGGAVHLLCQGRLETTEYGSKNYLTEFVLSDIYPAAADQNVNLFLAAGRAVRDGEFFIGSGEKKALWSGRMAVNRQISHGNTKTEYISVKAFDKKAEFATNWLPKGTPFFAKGVLSIGTYTDKNNVQQLSYDLLAFDIGFTSDKGAGQRNIPQSQPQASQASTGTDGFASGFNSGWGDLPL